MNDDLKGKVMGNGKVKYFKAWIIFFLVSVVAGFFLGAIAGGVVGGILGIMGVGLDVIRVAGAVAGFIISIPVSYICYRWTVSKFILSQVKTSPEQTGEEILRPEA
ncbi:MAG: hypothetical protein ACYSSO_12480 [Planctomycetota bacterium]|jgi:hypothetical protein